MVIKRRHNQAWSHKRHWYRRITYLCLECHVRRWVDLHHKDGNNRHNTMDNLLPVCKECHQKLDARLGKPHVRLDKITAVGHPWWYDERLTKQKLKSIKIMRYITHI